MVRALKVFVSYSRHGDEAKKVRALADWLTDVCDNKISFIIDSELRSDDDVFKFEQSINRYASGEGRLARAWHVSESALLRSSLRA